MKKLLLVAAMVVMAALSAYPFTVDGVTYSTADGVATVTGASNKAITKLTIPATVTYGGTTYPVNFMEGDAFWNCTSLRELVIEDSETYIGTNYVSQSSGTSTFLHYGDPFRDSPLEKVYVGRNLANRLGNGDLQSPTPITSTATSVDLTIAGKATFIPQGIAANMNMTFINRTNITSLTIGGNVENVYNKAFSGCTGLKKVTLLPGETITKFESNTVFEKCSIDSLIISRTFINNSAIKPSVIIIPKDCNWLEQNSFIGINIQKVVIADSENEIEIDGRYSIFTGCEIDSLYYGRVLKGQSKNIQNNAKIKNVVFGPNITNITQNYIYDHPELLSVSMSQNVTKIDNYAFQSCSGLTTVDIPSSVVEIGDGAFSACSSLTDFTLPQNLTSIGAYSFAYCPVAEIVIPSKVEFVGQNAFQNCSELRNIVIADSENEIEIDGRYSIFTGCEIDSLYYGRVLKGQSKNIQNNAKIKNVVFGPNITNITQNYISGHAELLSVSMSQNVTKIDNDAFQSCSALTSVDIPSSVVEIGDRAFFNCSSLTGFILPPNLTRIEAYSFAYCPVAEIVIPSKVEFVGQNAFISCSELRNVIIADSENEIEIDGRYSIFTDCEIDSLYYGRVLKGQSKNIQNRAKIKNVVFGPNITNITQNYIAEHAELLSVSMSQNVSKIDNNAFYGCPSLKEIYTKSTIPPLCENSTVFPTEVYDTALLTVPAGSKKAYRAAEVWKLFKNIQSEGGGFKVTVTCDSSLGEVALNGSNVAEITVDEDEPLTVAVTPIEGYKVTKMTVNGADVTASLIDNAVNYESIDSNMDIVVEFGIITFAVNLPAELTGGRIIVNGQETAPATVDYGSRLELAAVADRGYELTAFSVNGAEVIASLDENGTYVIENVTADINVEAAFDPIVYTVTAVNLTDFGTLTLNGETGDCKVAFGQPLVIGVMPRDEGCYLVSLTVDGTDVTANVIGGTYTVETVEADMTVEAVFGFYTYTVELGYDPAMGTIIPDLPGGDSDVTVAHGTTLHLTILPAEGYEIATVTLDGDDVTGRVDDNGVLTLETITAAHRVEATFEIKRVRLSVLGLQGGQLAMRYDYGTEVTLLVEPEEGWEFHSLTVGDTTVTELEPDGSYTTPALTDDTAVSVVFKLAGQSGANAPADARMITVATRGTTVIVTGAREGETVEIFDTAGVTVYRGTDHEIDLNRQGIHIVRVSGQTFKVMLK